MPIALLAMQLLMASQQGAAPLFAGDATLAVQLKGPLRTLIRGGKDVGELPFELSVDGAVLQADVRVRGKSRLRVCDFPLLRLDLKKTANRGNVFAGQDKLKLVTHCGKSRAAQSDVLQEYLAYRILSLITPISYRVRLLRIDYIDSDEADAPDSLVRYGFLLESEAELVTRLNGKMPDPPGVALAAFDDAHMALVYVFQYLIGNTDWSLVASDGDDACCHNGDIAAIGDTLYYIPYDFDLSGLVNASYARPDPSLRLRKVTHRRYRGFCMPRAVLQQSLRDVKNQRPEISRVVDELAAIDPQGMTTSAKYLDRFFSRAKNEERLLRSFERHCL